MTVAEITPRRGGTRRRHGPLSREVVLRRGIGLADAEGVDALTMRRLGQELGVQAMSLYNHVANKADLLDGITGTLLADMEIPRAEGLCWEDGCRVVAHAFRALAHEHPHLFPLILDRPLSAPESLPPFEAALAILRRGGFEVEPALCAFHALAAYVGGFALGDISELGLGRPPVPFASYDMLNPDELAATYPHVAEALPVLARRRRDEAFVFGLEALIVGLRDQLDQTGRGRPHQELGRESDSPRG
ncbi:MAG: TetR/AcrR family transcriptional regulator C-terminal domain-containing protein [Chloroflexia bacterium]|nr:TetR/AcrR family transcriptional regulator C-terminal domain-containing protein [Chloroflexia bacterium]